MAELEPFVIAANREYIPYEGLHPDALYQLSINPHPKLNLADLEELPLYKAFQTLPELWQNLLRLRQLEEGVVTFSREVYPYPYEVLRPIIFSPKTEQTYNQIITHAVRVHCHSEGRRYLAVEEAGYPMPFWSRSLLSPVQIVEGELQKQIKEGVELPEGVGTVYLDFPSSFHTEVTRPEIMRSIRANPSVLFIIDQANLYFSSQRAASVRNDLMLTGGEERICDDDLVLVLNTVSKTVGSAGLSVVAGTNRAGGKMLNLWGRPTPWILGFTEESYLYARQLLSLETQSQTGEEGNLNGIPAFEFRRRIIQNRDRLTAHLQEKFGLAATCPELNTSRPHIFLNADAFGFATGRQFCDFLYDNFSISTKPADVYTNTKKHPEHAKKVYLAIPWNDEIMEAVLIAFDSL